MVVLALPVFRFVEPCEPSYPARVAGYDDLGIWHDPGNGQFAKPGWSTAKGLVLDMVGDLLNSAREHVRHAPEGRALTVKDSRLTGIGVGAGDNVRVRYLNDEFGIVDVRRSGERRPHLVPWSRFSDTIPDPSAPVVDNPEFVNAPAVHEESSGLVDRLAANGGVGFVEVVGNDLNRYGVAAGSVLEARLGDDGAVTVTTPDGTRFRVPSRLVEPSIAPPDTPRTTEPGSAPDDVSAPTGVHVDDRREDSVGVPDRPSTPDIEAEPDDVDEADGSEPLTPPTTPEPDDEPDVQAEPEPGPDPIQEPDKIDEIPDPDIDPDEPEIPDDEDDGEVPVPRVGTREAWIADAVADHGVTREQVLDAYRDITGLRAEMRRQARAAQVPLLQTIDRVDALKVARPPAKKPVKQADGRTVWTRGAGSGEWDWFDHLGKAERNRIRNKWMVATRGEESAQASYAPDQLQQNIELAGVSDDVSTVDGAMQWWLDQIRMIDGLGNIALGRSAFNMDALGIELDGVKPSDILGRDRWDAAGAVAAARAAAADRYSSEEADMASQYLAAAYRAPEGERPWEIGYVRWVAELDDYLDAADAYEQDGKELPADIADRIDQLLPLGSDPNQSLEEAYAEIAEMAKAAGETVNPDLPGIPDAPAADAPSVDATTAPEQSATHAVATLFDRIHEKPTLEDKTEAEALADHIFAHDLGGGFSTKVTATNPNRSGGIDEMSLTVRGAIVAPDGRHVRSWQATITPENVNADTPLADQDPDIGVSFSRIDKGRGTIIDAALNSALSDAIRTAADDNGFGTDIEPAAAVAQAGEPVDLASLNPGDTFAASDIPGRWLMGSDGKVYGLNEDGTVTNGVLRDDVAAALSDREFTTAEPFEPAFPNAPELGTAFDGSNASVYASAVASGQVTLDELRDTLGMTEDQLRSVGRSGGGGGHEDVNNGSYGFAPLPEQMFHVTTAADSVLANGLKTASERQSGGTLGLGGSSDEISLASDVAHAEAIRDGILEAVDVAQGNITYDDMVRRAIDGDRGSQPFGDKFVAQMKYSLGLPDEWQPGDPIPETNGRDPLDLWKQFSLMRMNADGPRDPLVMTSADNLRRINPDQVQIMSVAPANDRAMGIPLNLGGTADDGEWRVPTGRALKVNGIADTPDTPDPGMFDAPSLGEQNDLAARRKVDPPAPKTQAATEKALRKLADGMTAWLGVEPVGDIQVADDVPTARTIHSEREGSIVVVNPSMIAHPEDGGTSLRFITHEAAHTISPERTLPGFSHDIEEGGAELLSQMHWAESYNLVENDAIRADGRWVGGPAALWGHGAYHDLTRDLLGRVLAENPEVTQADVKARLVALMRSDHYERMDFHQSTDGAPPATGAQLAWLLGGDPADFDRVIAARGERNDLVEAPDAPVPAPQDTPAGDVAGRADTATAAAGRARRALAEVHHDGLGVNGITLPTFPMIVGADRSAETDMRPEANDSADGGSPGAHTDAAEPPPIPFHRPTKRMSPTSVGNMVAAGEPLWHYSEVADDAQSMALLRTQVAVNMYDPAELSEDMDGTLGTLLWRENRGYKLSPDDVSMLGVARHEPEAVGRLFAKFRRQYEGKAANSKIPAEVELSADVRADAHAAWTETVTHPALVAAFDTIGVDPPNMILSRWREPWDDDRDANGTYTAGSNTVWINSTDFWGGISAGLSDEEARSFPISITERAPAAIGAATTSGGDRRGVMIHETGHYVHDHLAAAGGGFVGTPLADEWKQMWGAYHDAYIAATEAASGVPGGIAGLHRKQLSFYSHENFKEGFAETFGLVARGADPEGLDPEGRALFDWMSTNVFGLAPGESFADIEVGQTYSVNGVKIERTANGYVDVATGEPVNANGRPL